MPRSSTSAVQPYASCVLSRIFCKRENRNVFNVPLFEQVGYKMTGYIREKFRSQRSPWAAQQKSLPFGKGDTSSLSGHHWDCRIWGCNKIVITFLFLRPERVSNKTVTFVLPKQSHHDLLITVLVEIYSCRVLGCFVSIQ